jgi:hypothetical protein
MTDQQQQEKAKRGARMTTGRGWRLVAPDGRYFNGTLVSSITVVGRRLALFSVPGSEGPRNKKG